MSEENHDKVQEEVSVEAKSAVSEKNTKWYVLRVVSGKERKVKEYLDKYKSKMEIVGVAQESDNGDNWRKFLAGKPEFQWHHVLSRNNEDYILKFNVAGFPTKIIVDPEGKIVGRYVGEDDAIYKKLDELLGG